MKTVTFDETKWRLVPVEPTHEMEFKAMGSYVPQPDAPEVPIFDILDASPNLALRILRTIYTAMINAAPNYEDETIIEFNLEDDGTIHVTKNESIENTSIFYLGKQLATIPAGCIGKFKNIDKE